MRTRPSPSGRSGHDDLQAALVGGGELVEAKQQRLAGAHQRRAAVGAVGIAHAAQEYKPNLITDYLWNLAKAYSRFFNDCPVLKAETPMLRESRLLLCDLTARVLEQALCLLGIQTVESM